MIEHIHAFKEVKLINVVADNPSPEYSIERNGLWALLVRECDCGKQQAFEYGQRKAMQELLTRLTDSTL